MKFIRKYIGNRSFYREMFTVAMPIALQQLVSAVVNLLDSAEIGHWGNMTLGTGGSEIASAAIIIANRYFSTFYNIMAMVVISCTIFIAQYFGAKHFEKTKKVFGLSLKLALGFAIIGTVLGFIFKEQIIFFFSTGVGSGAQMLYYGEQYLSIVLLTLIPYSISTALSFCFRSTKRTMVPLISSASAAITNFFLNYIFIYVLNLGVSGAAIATVISRFVELGILAIYYFKSNPCFRGTFQETFKAPIGFAKNIISKGFPMVLASVITEGIAIFMFFSYAQIEAGNAANIAAVNLSSSVVDIVAAFVGGMGTAAAIMVGTRLGAGKIEEAKRNARWQIGYIILLSIATIIIMIALIPLIQYVYEFQDESALLLSMVMILHALSLPFMFYSNNVIFITRSGGYTKAPMLITNIPYVLIKIPLVALFVFIIPNAFSQWTGLHNVLSAFGLSASLVIFVFIIDRLVEVIRGIVAFFVLHKAPWAIDMTEKKPDVGLPVD